jgi:dissimilatory sulfite reductase (desulfoviridin) alpha/beta subunit
VLTGKQLHNIAAAAEQYGSGTVTFTTRLTVEIPGVHYESIPAVQKHLADDGLETGGTGAKVRPVVACKGTTCVFGLIDTQKIAEEIHDRFYTGYRDVTLPHKFKIAVGGCPNNCVKPDLNDFGMIGQHAPAPDPEICRGCKKCIVEANCLMHAAKVVDGKIKIDDDLCNACGKCIRNCYFQSIAGKQHGVKILIGGKWGREGRKGSALSGIYSVEEAMDILERALLVFRKYAYQKERFGAMVERLGHDQVEAMLLSDAIMAEKDAILSAPIRTKK